MCKEGGERRLEKDKGDLERAQRSERNAKGELSELWGEDSEDTRGA